MRGAFDPTARRFPERHEILVLICTSVPSFMVQLDASIVSVSLPVIARSLSASFAGIEWVITAYMLSFASLLLPAGALADRFGRKRLLILGLSVFTFASFLCGSAQTLGVLIAARALQGSGAALQLSSSLATLSHSFQGHARARAFSFWGTVYGMMIHYKHTQVSFFLSITFNSHGVFMAGPSATDGIEGVISHGTEGARSMTILLKTKNTKWRRKQ